MSKRIEQRVDESGTVRTYTRGAPRGDLSNFDVSLTTPPSSHKQSTEFVVELSDGVRLELGGRRARTLLEVLTRHFEAVEDVNY